ncbi:MAG: hypothetical protein QW367_02385 [Candidatus Aenigmatarchaeota archaeon]
MDVNRIIEEYKKSKKLSFYELLCNFSFQIIKIKLPKEEEELYNEVNKFCRLRIPPASNFSAAILVFLFGIIGIVILAFSVGFSISFIFFILLALISFLIYYYPFLKAKLIRNFASSEMMHAIIYMSISLKQVPNLERAVVLVANNLSGEIGKDFKRILAKFLVGESTIKEGLNEIIERWYKEAKEFCEALKLLIAYSENPYSSENLIKEAIRIMHEENFQRMEKYARSLKLPSTIILGLGVILPLLSLTILPLFSIFFPQIFSFTTLVIVFNVILPIILFLVIITLITSRPLTTSFLLIENPLEIKFSNFKINLIFVGILISLILSSLTLPNFISLNYNFEKCVEWANTKFKTKPKDLTLSKEECERLLRDNFTLVFLAISSLFLLFVPISLILIFALRNILLKRKIIEKIESEFPTVLYQTGYYLRAGNPLEIAINKGIERYKKFEIGKLFEKLLSILSYSGNLKESIEKIIKIYPSSIIKNSFEIIIESYKKGYRFAGDTMIIISEYLSNLFKLQAKIEELISDNVNNLKFIITFLMPIIIGTGISLVIILLSLIIKVFFSIGELPTQESTEALPLTGIPFISASTVSSISFGSITFSLGIYLVEMIIISSLLIVGLENGLERYNFLSFLSKTLIISLILYILTVLFSSLILTPMIETIVQV